MLRLKKLILTITKPFIYTEVNAEFKVVGKKDEKEDKLSIEITKRKKTE